MTNVAQGGEKIDQTMVSFARTIATFALAIFSDGIDGYIARRDHQKTLLRTTWTPIMPARYIVLSFASEAIILLGTAFI